MELLLIGVITCLRQVLAVGFAIIWLLLIILVLLQKGRGGGLVGALGGAGGQSAFGSKTGDVFTWITVVFVGVFLVLAAFLSSPIGYVPTSSIDDTQFVLPNASGTPGTVPSSESGPDSTPSTDTPDASPERSTPEKPVTDPATKPDTKP